MADDQREDHIWTLAERAGIVIDHDAQDFEDEESGNAEADDSV
jgi:hypothetical protein